MKQQIITSTNLGKDDENCKDSWARLLLTEWRNAVVFLHLVAPEFSLHIQNPNYKLEHKHQLSIERKQSSHLSITLNQTLLNR